MPKPEIVTRPINTAVDRVGLPITLTCKVSGDPSHYWVGWMYRNSVIQRRDEDYSHSFSTSPSYMPNGTTHHLTIHSLKAPGNYTCQVYSIEGKQLDNVTHQVSVKGMLMPKLCINSSYVPHVSFYVLESNSESSSLFVTFLNLFFKI